jgi:hypothetical protein
VDPFIALDSRPDRWSALLNSLATFWDGPPLRAFSGLCAIIAMYLACLFDLLGITVPSVRLPESINSAEESRLYFQRFRQREHVVPAHFHRPR